MYLPPYIVSCIQALEQKGYAAWAVGGCVRDALLGLEPHDYDLCTSATPERIKAIFSHHRLVLSGEKHGTVGVITDSGVVEITTFRTEGAYLDNRHPEQVAFVATVEEDLARRDFTVNAMAYNPERGLADPFGGRQDLQDRVLRCVGEPAMRFQEDSLRILRGVRFAVRFRLKPQAQTLAAMESQAPLMDNLARERVFEELCKLLPLLTAEDLRTYRVILSQVIPELAPTMGFDQHSKHHAYDLYTHIAHVTAAVPPQLALRWAALLHDVGKIATFSLDEDGNGHFYGHAKASAQMAEEILRRLKAPNALRQEVVQLIEQHMTRIEPEEKTVRRWLSRLGEERMESLILLQEADMGSKGTGKSEESAQFHQLRGLIQQIRADNACLSLRDLAVDGRDMLALGLSGPDIGRTLEQLLELVLEGQVPNETEALLHAAAVLSSKR